MVFETENTDFDRGVSEKGIKSFLFYASRVSCPSRLIEQRRHALPRSSNVCRSGWWQVPSRCRPSDLSGREMMGRRIEPSRVRRRETGHERDDEDGR